MHKRLTSIGTAALSLGLLLLPTLALAQDVPPTPGEEDLAPEGDFETDDLETDDLEADDLEADDGGDFSDDGGDFSDDVDATGEGGTVGESAQQTGMKIDLRIWNGFAKTVEGATRKETFHLPMFGLTFTSSPASLEGFGFMFTFLAGFGEGDMTELNTNFFAKGEQETFRWDFEALIRYSLPRSNVYLMGGLRTLSWEEDGDLAIVDGAEPGRASADVDAFIFLVELGVGLTGNITEDGAHRVFANMVFGLGHFGGDYDYDAILLNSGISIFENARFDLDWDEFTFSFDGNLGYQASLTDALDLSVRYRVFLISADLTRGSDLDNVIMHGLEFTFGFRF